MKTGGGDGARRPRGRPRSFAPDAALGRVSEVFWERGFGGCSLDELAAASGLNRPNLSAAFGDKRALYRAALARVADTLSVALGALDGPGPLRDRLAAFYKRAIDAYLSGGAGRGCLIMCTAPAESFTDPDVRALLARVQSELDERLSALFARARAAGEIDPAADPAALGQLATAVLQSLALRARAGTPRPDLDRFTLAALASLLPPAPRQNG